MEQNCAARNFRQFGVPRNIVLFLEILENSSLEISGNSNRNFWSNRRKTPLLAENFSCEHIFLMSRQLAEFNSYFLENASKIETIHGLQCYRYFKLASTVLDSRFILPALIVSVGLFKKPLIVSLVCV